MVTHDPKAAERARPHRAPGEGRARELTAGALRRVRPDARAAQPVRHRLRTLLTASASSSRSLVRAAAHGRRRLVRRRERVVARRAWSRATRSRSSSRCRSPTRRRIRQVDGVDAASPRSTGSAASTAPSATSSRSSRSTRRPTSTLYPEFVLPPERAQGVLRDRKGAIVGRKLAEQYGLKVGDAIPLRGTIFPGTWKFTVRGIYDGADKTVDHATVLLPLGLPERDDQEALPAARRPGGSSSSRSATRRRRPRCRRRSTRVRELARRDADRDREGVPARLRRDDRGDRARDPGGVVRGDRDHHGGDGQHDGDDGARALRRVRDAEGAGLRPASSPA